MKSNTVVNFAFWSKEGGLEKLHLGYIYNCVRRIPRPTTGFVLLVNQLCSKH
jgi:hypothetical protein